jgi:AcrR family transcriptional regulator
MRSNKKSREQRARETREALVRAGFKVVSRHGYAGASVSRITETSGVAAGTLYSYFDTHQQLLDQLLPAEGVRLLDILRESAHRSADYFDHEKRTFAAFLAYLKSRPYFLRVLTEAEIAAPESYAQHMRNIEGRYLRALHRAQENDEVRPQSDRSFRVIAEALSGARGYIAIGFSDRSAVRAFRPGHPPEWVVDTYVKFIRHGLDDGPVAVRAAEAPRGRDSRAKASGTRSLLLDAAARVIRKVGYPRASVLAIAQEAGFAVGTFYAHFPSRQQLFEELVTYVREDLLNSVRDAVRGSRSFAELECRGFHAFCKYLSRNPWYIRIETEAAVWAPASFIGHFFDLADRYTSALRRSRARGELQAYEERELPILGFMLMGARRYLASRYLLAAPRLSLPSWVGETYVDLVLRGLQRRP